MISQRIVGCSSEGTQEPDPFSKVASADREGKSAVGNLILPADNGGKCLLDKPHWEWFSVMPWKV
jgi:hypothetical protein